MKPRPVVLLVLIALSVAARLIPYALSTLGVPIDPANTIYPWNFSPILKCVVMLSDVRIVDTEINE